jgi:hypothetical protein
VFSPLTLTLTLTLTLALALTRAPRYVHRHERAQGRKPDLARWRG